MTEAWDASFLVEGEDYTVAPRSEMNPAGDVGPEVLSAETEVAASVHQSFPEVFEAGSAASLDASGVPDTACRKTLVGEYTLECICRRL